CGVLQLEELVDDERFRDNAARHAHRGVLRGLVEAQLATRSAAEWIERIIHAGVPASPVLSIEEALDHTVADELSMVRELDHPTIGSLRILGRAVNSNDDGWLTRPPPLLGEHTAQICDELGMSNEELRALLDAAVLYQSIPSRQGRKVE